MEIVQKKGQYLGLLAGANAVTLHDGTPKKNEEEYVIYKKNRYKPKGVLFKVLKKAGLQASSLSIIKEQVENTLFYKLINMNLRHNKVAVYSEGQSYSYGDLSELISKFLRAGFNPALFCYNSK